MLHTLVAAAPAIGQAPPGTSNLITILGWVSFLVGLALMGAFAVSMGKAGFSALRHGQFEGGSGAVICLVAGVFLAASGAIFGALGIGTS